MASLAHSILMYTKHDKISKTTVATLKEEGIKKNKKKKNHAAWQLFSVTTTFKLLLMDI